MANSHTIDIQLSKITQISIMTNNKKPSTYFIPKLNYWVLALLLLLSIKFYSQTVNTVHSKKTITAEFLFPDVEFEELAVISNVLKIKNNNTKTYVFTVTMSLPLGWRTLNNSDKEYSLFPGDSLFVPIRLLTKNKSAKGGTKYNINAFIATNEGRQMAMANFRAGRPKVSDWQVNILPRPRIYFLNNETEAPFQINLTNNGDEAQELILSMNKIGKDFTVADGSGKFLKKSYYEFILPPSADTTMPFTAVVQKPERNIKRLDNYNYVPNALQQEKHFGLYIKAAEVGARQGTGVSKNKKVDFVKLANNINFVKLSDATKLNQYGAATIPVTMVANVNNILGQQPIMNVIFNGNTVLNKNSSVNYFLQTGFTYYKIMNQTAQNSAGVITYNHVKGFVSAGSSVSLNMDNLRGMVSGKGISAGYRLTPKQSIGTYYVRNGQTFANYRSYTIGTGYSARFSKLQFGAGYDRTNDTSGAFSNSVNANIAAPIGANQYLGVNGRYSITNMAGNILNSRFYGMFYKVSYLKRKANTNINLSYSEATNNMGPGVILNNNFNNYRANLVNYFNFKNGLILNLVSNYNIFQSGQVNNVSNKLNNTLFNNILSLQLPNRNVVNYSPAIYFVYSDYYLERMVSYGLQFNMNTYNPDENFRMGVFLKGGYNKLLSAPELGTFFNGQANSIFTYRTWNCNIRYSYGPVGQGNIANLLIEQKRYPQKLSGSIGNQYQFKNVHFILENTINYSYMNVNQRHNIGLFSQLFYYTNSAWRFNFNFLYNYNISESYKYIYSPGVVNNFVVETTPQKSWTQNFQLGMGLKKDFGIPIPKKIRKMRYCDAHFKVFLDINGNKKFDSDEIPLENIVLRMNDFEVLSNEKGEASFVNMAMGSYKLQVLPLVDVGAWFPVTPDSMEVCGPSVIYIPFSKGVEILGNVVVDREKFSADIVDKLDISRIKIFLIDTLGNTISAVTDNRGNFKFYVPYGQYRLKFDEKILGDNFELAENDIDILLTNGMESYYHTFFIMEKKRKVKNKKFGADGSVTESLGEASSSENRNGGKNANDTNANKKFADASDGVENLKTFDKGKTDSINKVATASRKTEDVENLRTFGKPKKSDVPDVPNNINPTGGINWVQMDSLIDILIGKTNSGLEITAEDLARIEESKITKSDLNKFANKTVYTIQIGAYTAGLPKSLLSEILRLNVKVESFKDPKDGLTKYFSGYYDTYDEASNARAEIEQRGLNGPFIISIHNGEIISIQDLLKKIGK